MKLDRYTCHLCGEEFDSDWSQEEAEEEFRQIFGQDRIEDAIILCDSCFRQQMARLQLERAP